MRWIAVLAVCLVAAGARADWSVRRDPFDPKVVGAYKAILARDPYDDAALRQLVGLYRSYRTVAALEAEYRKQLAAGETWATLVVLARLPAADAVALWQRAVAQKPDDARAWIAIGDTARTDATTAVAAYRHAATVAKSPRDKRAALTKLVAVARDPAVVDGAYAELVALSPKDGTLLIERGNAQLAGKQYAGARESFAKAESLLAGDPERRLTAMSSQGIALERLGQPDEAIAQYERTLARMPAGYFLGQELVGRIVEVERRRGRLAAVIERFEQRWPEARRGHFEWAVLADLYADTQRTARALAAYKRAVDKAPYEVATQRKLIALLDRERPAEALAQHAAAARAAPGDAPLQLELAKRYQKTDLEKAIATLDALTRRFATSVGVRSSVAELYEDWNEPRRAIEQYEAIAKLEPNDPEHALVLGEAYWRLHEETKALAAWARIDKIGTADAFHRHGEVLAIHAQWDAAATAYTKALARDATKRDTLFGRARAYEALRRLSDAIADARRAVALAGDATFDDGQRSRNLLTRVLGKSYTGSGPDEELGRQIARWRFAFDHGDVSSGYLLAAHHARIGSYQQHAILVELYRRVPEDGSLGLEVVRSYLRQREFDHARAELERIGQRSPAMAEAIAAMRETIEEMRARAEIEIRHAEAGNDSSKYPDVVGANHRLGFRFMIGSDIATASGALGGVGLYRSHRVARGTAWAWRFDTVTRNDDLIQNDAALVGVGIAKRFVDARRFELAIGAGMHFELRWGEQVPSERFDRAALGVDATLELFPRAVPAVLGLRLHQSLTDAERTTGLFVELGFEVR